MIAMDQFQKIVQWRNEGRTQEEIARDLGIDVKTVRTYLKTGKIPVYQRAVRTREDKFIPFKKIVEKMIEDCHGKILAKTIFCRLLNQGYVGSYRDVARKTNFLRRKFKGKEIFFEKVHICGEFMEGDFTEIHGVLIGGQLVVVHLWNVVLCFSNAVWATPFFFETFECFAQGSADAFAALGGMAESYRLDNLTPVVTKILKRGRETTTRFDSLQRHYGFKAQFCNPAKGNEKGNVESMNNVLKRAIAEKLVLDKLSFANLDKFCEFVARTCRELNARPHIQAKWELEKKTLKALPLTPFEAFQSYQVKVNKYSTFTFEKSNHRYSAPAEYIGLTLEARVYHNRVELIAQDKVLAKHPRLFGEKKLCSVMIEHIIEGLCRKPGVVKDWKYRAILFENPAWNHFFTSLADFMDPDQAIREYLKSLRLFNRFGREVVTTAMELLSNDQSLRPTYQNLENIITNQHFDPMAIAPVGRDLTQYDEFLGGSNVH